MNGLFFYIGLGAGLAAACGLRPFLPLLLAGGLGSAGALGISFGHGHFQFLQADWWLLAVAAAFVAAYALQLLAGLDPVIDPRERPRASGAFASVLAGLALGAGALLFAGTLEAHGDASWPGLLGGLLIAGLAQRVAGPVIVGARARLADRPAREALIVYLDAAALLLAALTALLHPFGYMAVAALAWFLWRRRARGEERYAGLRILRR